MGDVERDATSPAFEVWVSQQGPVLLRFAYLQSGDAARAEDLLQDVLVAIYPRWKQLSSTVNMDAYVKKAIVNRQRSRWRRVEMREVLLDEVDSEEAVAVEADFDVGKSELWEWMQELPERQRAALVLRFYEDFTYRTIGSIIDCSEQAARLLVHRGLSQLKVKAQKGSAEWTP